MRQLKILRGQIDGQIEKGKELCFHLKIGIAPEIRKKAGAFGHREILRFSDFLHGRIKNGRKFD